MKFLILSCIFLICAVGQIAAQNCHLRELDLCAATLLVFTQNPNGVAQTDAEINKQCNYIREANACYRNFTRKCTTTSQRDLVTFLTEGSRGLIDDFCRENSDIRRKYLKHASCLNEAQKDQKICIRDFQAALEVISNVDYTNRFAAGCCAYRRFQGCSEGIIQQKCGKDTVNFLHVVIRMAFSRLPDLVCQGYGSDNPNCRSLLPPSGTNPKGAKSTSVLSKLFSAYTGL